MKLKLVSVLVPALALSSVCLPVWAGSCLTGECHPEMMQIGYPHAPVQEENCLACHRQRQPEHPLAGSRSFDLIAEGASLCNQCHPPIGTRKTVHPPVRTGECLGCHRPHGAAGRFLLDEHEDLSRLCFACHEEAPFRQRFTHGPAAAGVCTCCHSPHESDLPALLVEEMRSRCLKCHAEFGREMSQARIVHSPVQNSSCTSCHDPHSSSSPFMLRRQMPDLCLECHTGIGQLLKEARSGHPPLKDDRSCGNCHSTHYSGAKGLLAAEERVLCLGCHGGSGQSGSPLKNIRKELEGDKKLHGPLQTMECGPCHSPHGSDHYRLLRGEYPEGIYANYREGTYDFCLKCHQKHLLQFKNTTLYTDFRDGDRNLHYVHVARPKGRSCRFCHEPHASDGPKLTSREGIPFGDWQVPNRLELTPTGGSCSPGCHSQATYDRQKPAKDRRGNGSR